MERFKHVTISFKELSSQNKQKLYKRLYEAGHKDDDIHVQINNCMILVSYLVSVPFDADIQDAVDYDKKYMIENDIPFVSITYN